jgi:acyl carrier protein
MARSVEEIIAAALQLRPVDVTDDAEMTSLEGWDSLGHVNLMLELELEFGITIDEAAVLSLTSVRAIRAFVAARISEDQGT